MARFQVTVSDESGAKVYDETIDAEGPIEACAKAVADARVAAEAAGGSKGSTGADMSGDVGAIG